MKLTQKVEDLKKSEIGDLIGERIKEFKQIRRELDEERIFSELCFCLLTANFQAKKCIEIQESFVDSFVACSQEELAQKLKEVGHRFWPQRAERIFLARNLKKDLISFFDKDQFKFREWLVENVKGLGMKEASHFLRNVGFENVAIVDFHIVDLLVREGLMEKPPSKSFTRKRYLEIEEILRKLGEDVGLELDELDLYLWYVETGSVLK
jgi:N-glycosylase/DNA lyase